MLINVVLQHWQTCVSFKRAYNLITSARWKECPKDFDEDVEGDIVDGTTPHE